MMEFYTYKNHTAKKDHTCDLCGLQIKQGEQYIRFSGKFDGDMFDLKYHKECQAIIDAYCDHTGENEYDEWCLIDWLADRLCDDCIHGARQEDDCTTPVLRCGLIKERFAKQCEVD